MASGGESVVSQAFTLLACVAAEPRIGPVLFVDLDPAVLPAFARHLGDLVRTLEPQRPAPEIHTLGSWTDSEDLWLRPRSTSGRLEFVPGPLAEPPGAPAPILVITQLGAVGLGVLRTLLTQPAEPRVRWLAAAGRDELATMSPHLLDRFVARIDGELINEELSAALRVPGPGLDAHELIARSAAGRPAISMTARVPVWTDAATNEVIRTVPRSVSRRQDLALSRAAATVASFVGAASVTSSHVMRAAQVLGLSSISPQPPDPQTAPPPGPRPTPEPAPAAPPVAERTHRRTVRGPGPARSEQVAAPDTDDELTATSGDLSRGQTLYPELEPDALPVPGSLRAPRRGKGAGHGSRGPVVGVKPVQSPAGLRDLALCATIIQASLFRAAHERTHEREQDAGAGASVTSDAVNGHPSAEHHHGLVHDHDFIHARDLRQFLRRTQNRHTLILVIDHSCLPGWRWQALLGPQLSWAYRKSAAVAVVEFGHHDTIDELAAHVVQARHLVDPRVARSVSGRVPGKASPLAHALDLTARRLRRAVWSAGADDEIRLVVLTDGRGNVPLSASLRGRPPTSPVRREGVEDALRAAEVLRGLSRARVRRYLLGPQPHQYPGLLYDLADALDAELHLGAPEETGPRERRA